MNIEKINDFIDAYSRALELKPRYTRALKELLPKLIQKYSQQIQKISDKQDDYDGYIIKPDNGKYSIEDFFLNRLMRNVLSIQVNNIPGDNDKGGYHAGAECISFNPSLILRQLDGKLPENMAGLDQIKETAAKKVIMHEFEHALQTQLKRGNGVQHPSDQRIYKKIIDEILKIKNGKYKDKIQTFDEIARRPSTNKMVKHNGLISSSYSSSIIGNTNEIFNETESLEMAGSKVQARVTYADGSYFPIRNAESSNKNITNYGDFIKILVNPKSTFIGMYIEPEMMFKTFNSQYGDIFKEAYGNEKKAWDNLMEQINKIKSTNAKQDHLMLQTILAKCLDKKVEQTIQAGKLTPENLPQIQSAIMTFENNMISHKDKNVRDGLEHIQILESISEKVRQFDRSGPGLKQEMGMSQAQAEELKKEQEEKEKPCRIIKTKDN